MVATSDDGLVTYGIEDLWLPRRQGTREVGLFPRCRLDSRFRGNDIEEAGKDIGEIGNDMRESVGMALAACSHATLMLLQRRMSDESRGFQWKHPQG